VLASAVAAGVHSQVFGPGALFVVPTRATLGLGSLPAFAVLGVLAGVLAIVVTGGLFVVEAGFRRLPVPEFWHPVIGAIGFGLVGLLVPRVLGVGYDSIDAVLTDRLAVGTLAALLIGKLVAWWVALGSGTSGGTLAPILLIGGSAGGLLGALGAHLGLGIPAGAVAAVAMAATFGASTRAPFTSIVFLFELTQDYHLILPLMIATVIAYVVASAALPDGLMTEKLSRRGLRVRHAYEVDLLRTTTVGDVMSAPARSLPPDLSIPEARERFDREGLGAFPLVGPDGALTGIVARGDLLRETDGEALPLIDIATRDVVTVEAGDTVLHALRLMLEEDVDHLPVVQAGMLVGMCSRTDVLRARGQGFEHERAQPGWRPAP
jgi:chloride channel protein, CIC family